MIRFSYNWRSIKTIWWNLRGIPFDLYYGLCNLKRWFWIAWYDNDSDYTPLLAFMESKLRSMADLHTRAEGKHLHWEREVRHMLTCAALCKRLQDDEYFQNAGYKRPGWEQKSDGERQRIAKLSNDNHKADLEMLGAIMGKRLYHWWH